MPHVPKQNKVKNAVIGSFFLATLISRRFFKTDSGGLLETMTNNAAVSGGTVVLFLYKCSMQFSIWTDWSAMDSYFEKQDKPTVFIVLGKEVIVDDERLATALSKLPELRREVLLLYYFVGYRDEAIGRQYGRCRSTINHRRNVALKQLRKEWEKLKHEEQKADTF